MVVETFVLVKENILFAIYFIKNSLVGDTQMFDFLTVQIAYKAKKKLSSYH